MLPFQVCFAPTLSWALVFLGPALPGPSVLECFSEQVTCEIAARAANDAFKWDSGHVYNEAHCEAQPPKKD